MGAMCDSPNAPTTYTRLRKAKGVRVQSSRHAGGRRTRRSSPGAVHAGAERRLVAAVVAVQQHGGPHHGCAWLRPEDWQPPSLPDSPAATGFGSNDPLSDTSTVTWAAMSAIFEGYEKELQELSSAITRKAAQIPTLTRGA